MEKSFEEMKKILEDYLQELKKKRAAAWSAHEAYMKNARPDQFGLNGCEECHHLALVIDNAVELGKKLGLLPSDAKATNYY